LLGVVSEGHIVMIEAIAAFSATEFAQRDEEIDSLRKQVAGLTLTSNRKRQSTRK
jgi:hypothetical protein